MDLDKDHQVSREEFAQFVEATIPDESGAEAMAEFDTVDSDADGFITLTEACYARNHKLLALPQSFI